MKIVKFIVPALLIAATPASAFAARPSDSGPAQCLMTFPTPFNAWQFIPCIAGFFSR